MLASLWFLCLSSAVICRADIAIPGVSKDSGLTDAEKKALLDEHNYLRSQQAQGLISGQPPAADMTRLEWSDSTAANAQVWANNCGGPPHGNHKQFGEGQNYAANSNRGALLRGAIQGWFHNEYPIYTYGSPPGAAGHYTQMVTAFSHKVGCGANKCHGYSMGRLVCNFFVGGNMYGKPPFQKGLACSKCPAGYGFCKDNLCTSARVCSASDSSCRCTVDQAKCAKNGKFNAATCSCECKVGFQGLNCNVECEDVRNKGCKDRARQGNCKPSASNKYFVDTYLSCPAACGRCKPACKNLRNDCAQLKAWGNCEKSKSFMETYCAKECGFCTDVGN